MSSEPPANITPPSAVPPMVPGPLQAMPSAPGWPLWLGIVAILVGAMGGLAYLWGVVANALLAGPPTFGMPAAAEVREATRGMRGYAVLSAALGLIPAVLLLVAGIGMVMRRRWSIPLARFWAVAKILVSLPIVAINWKTQVVAFSAITSGSTSGAAPMSAGMISFVLWLTVLGGLAIHWALPVFMLIWLARQKVRAYAATWS